MGFRPICAQPPLGVFKHLCLFSEVAHFSTVEVIGDYSDYRVLLDFVMILNIVVMSYLESEE